MQLNVIELVQTEWEAMIVFDPKKDETLRFCVDYRELNAITVRDSYPFPSMEDCID